MFVCNHHDHDLSEEGFNRLQTNKKLSPYLKEVVSFILFAKNIIDYDFEDCVLALLLDSKLKKKEKLNFQFKKMDYQMSQIGTVPLFSWFRTNKEPVSKFKWINWNYRKKIQGPICFFSK